MFLIELLHGIALLGSGRYEEVRGKRRRAMNAMPRNTTTDDGDETARRIERALNEDMRVEQTAPGLFDVRRWSDMADPQDPSDDPADYADGAKVCTVDLTDGRGTCPDAQHRDGKCKHYFRAMLAEGLQGVAMALSEVVIDTTDDGDDGDDRRDQPPTPDRGQARPDGGQRTVGGDLPGEPTFTAVDPSDTQSAPGDEQLPGGFETMAKRL